MLVRCSNCSGLHIHFQASQGVNSLFTCSLPRYGTFSFTPQKVTRQTGPEKNAQQQEKRTSSGSKPEVVNYAGCAQTVTRNHVYLTGGLAAGSSS